MTVAVSRVLGYVGAGCLQWGAAVPWVNKALGRCCSMYVYRCSSGPLRVRACLMRALCDVPERVQEPVLRSLVHGYATMRRTKRLASCT